MQVAKAILEKVEVQFSEKDMSFDFPEKSSAYLHTAHHRQAPLETFLLQCAETDGAHNARSTRMT